MSSAMESRAPAMPVARAREVLGDFSIFLEKRNPAVELHREIYDDTRTGERVLSITALALDGHVLKHEVRRKVQPSKDLGEYCRQKADIDCNLLRELSRLEAHYGVDITLGRWC